MWRVAVFVVRIGRAVLPEPVQRALLNLWVETRIARQTSESAKIFAGLQSAIGLKVHLGCGKDIRSGWLNVDLLPGPAPRQNPSADTVPLFINHDLRQGLPLAEGCCDLIYSSHFFEHLEYLQALKLMRDCYRALRPGGVFRVALPNLGAFFEAYLRKDREFVSLIDIRRALPYVEPGSETLIDYVNYAAYQSGEHKWIYDEEKVVALLRSIGYRQAAPAEYQPEIDVTSPLRRRYSFYVEAVK